MVILSIETSCDDTSCAIIDDNYKVLASYVSSQNDIHKAFGGVVPEVASRQHLSMMPVIFKKTLAHANLKICDLDGIAATLGPGLVGSLLVGIMFAKGIAFSTKKPFFGVNHIEGHFFASFLQENRPDFPFIALVASGGHTAIYLVNGFRDYKLIGQTRDDAAGEAFDKVAKLLNLGYPGGVAIEEAAQDFEGTYSLPYPLEKEDDFSFSGLKTAILSIVKRTPSITPEFVKDLSASFQKMVIKILVDKTIKAAEKYNIKQIVISGGVASNKLLRKTMLDMADAKSIKVFIPSKHYCTDNAAMIGVVGHYFLSKGFKTDLSASAIADWAI